MEVVYEHDYGSEPDNIPQDLQISEYFANLSQDPDQLLTSAGLAVHDLCGKPDDMLTGQFSFKEAETLILNSNTALECFCPVDACNCPRQAGCKQGQEYCLPPAAFQLKGPGKMLERAPVQDNWNLDGFLVGTSSDIDGFNLNGNGILFRSGRP